MDKIRVLIADDHEVVRMGLALLLSRHPQLAVAGEAGSAPEAVARVRELRPDVVVMDIRMPGGGIEACREIKSFAPETKVIMLTSYTDEEALFGSIMAGASGYVLKEVRGQSLVDAIITVGRGGSLLDPVTTGKVLDKIRTLEAKGGGPQDQLNEQEKKIVALIAEGHTNREIAAKLLLSEKTVRNYVSSILAKLNLSNRAQVAVYAERSRFTR